MPTLPSPTTLPDAAHSRAFEVIQNQYFALESRWTIYRELVATSKRDRELLRKYLGYCATALIESLGDDLFVRVARLIDRRTDVVSLWDLAGRLDRAAPPPKRGSLQAKLLKVSKLAENVVKHRHKRIAHLDSKAATERIVWLPKVERRELARVVRALGDFIRQARATWQPGTAMSLILDGDGDSLLLQLRRVDALLCTFNETDDAALKDTLRPMLRGTR